MMVAVTIGQVYARPIAVVHRTARLADLATVVPDACGEVWRFVRAHNVTGTGHNVAVYLDEAMHIACGVEVPATFVGDGTVVLSATPAGRVAHAEHRGAYHLLGQTHTAVRQWCAANGQALSGPNWEIYGHWTDDPDKLNTDVFYLLET